MSKRCELINSAICVASEESLENLTTRKVAKRANCSEALIFKHFKNKEELLQECFVTVHRKIEDMMDNFEITEGLTPEEQNSIYSDIWVKMMQFAVSLGPEAVFYFDFISSPKLMFHLKENGSSGNGYCNRFTNIMHGYASSRGLSESESQILVNFVTETFGAMVKKLIRNEIPNNMETLLNIQRYVFKGITSERGIL